MRDLTGVRHGDLHDAMSGATMGRGRGRSRAARSALPQGRFGNLFDDLPAFSPPTTFLERLAIMMSSENQLTGTTGDSATPAGYTIFGQFVTHDLTFDTTPLAQQRADQPAANNYRTPRLDLDSIYKPSPRLTQPPPCDPATGKMEVNTRLVNGKQIEDVPRDAQGQAIIGDIRNDENVLVSQLHLAFLKLHNVFVDDIIANGIDGRQATPKEAYCKARQRCQWHFQWLVVHDYLPRIVGKPMVKSILGTAGGGTPTFDLRLYKPPCPRHPMMPVEFSAAAFRFGHSMIRSFYVVNPGGDDIPVFPSQAGDGFHLGGSRPLLDRLVVKWARFFDDLEPGTTIRRNVARKIDPNLSQMLRTLPPSALLGNTPAVVSLALRDLRRGVNLKLPSGQAVARKVHERTGPFERLSKQDLGLSAIDWQGEAPLWFYILKEAQKCGGGEHLGPVGGRIVGEVILGLLKYDPTSYLRAKPAFRPGVSTVGGLLQLAGVA